MKIRDMTGIEVAFIGLKVIALVENFGHKHMAGRREKRFVPGKKRRLARSHVAEDNSGALLAGIGRMVHFLAKPFARRLAGLFEAITVSVVKPAVVETAQATVLDPSITQVGASMRAMQAE